MNRRDILVGLTVLPLVAAGRAGVAASPRATFGFALRRGRIFIPARINGVSVEGLLDSGAEMSVLDSDFARSLGIAPDRSVAIRGSGAGTQAAGFASNVVLHALGTAIEPAMVAVTDLSDVSSRLAKEAIRLIVGRELFDVGPWTIDFARSIITRGDPDRPVGGVRLPLTSHMGIETMPITIAGRPAQAACDLGNGSLPMVSAAFATRAGLLADGAARLASSGGIGGAVTRRIVAVKTIAVAGRKFGPIEVAIDDAPDAPDANLGTSVLRHFRLTLDYPRRSIWLA